MNELEQNYLEHHGILGQKWHKRNGPPYPLDAGDHSKSEQNAGYKKSLGGGRNDELYNRKGTLKRHKATRLLNKHDQARAEDEYRAEQHLTKSIKSERKYEKIGDRYAKKINKLNEKQRKELEKANSARDDHFDNVVITSEKSRKLAEKAAKLEEKGAKKIAKEMAKSKNELAIASEYMEYAAQHKKEVENIISSIDPADYNVKSTEGKRIANRGQMYTANMLGTMIAGPLGGLAASGGTVKMRNGTYYKVKNKK